MAVLGVGLAATVTPTLLAYGLTEKDSKAEDIAIYVGIFTSAIAGPAVGLWSGGRGDLAKQGLIARGIGCAFVGAGFAGGAMVAEGTGTAVQTTGVLMIILGVGGAILTTGSVLHDLAITPWASGHDEPVSVAVGIRPDGMLAVRVKF
jgi:hypothetical protein